MNAIKPMASNGFKPLTTGSFKRRKSLENAVMRLRKQGVSTRKMDEMGMCSASCAWGIINHYEGRG